MRHVLTVTLMIALSLAVSLPDVCAQGNESLYKKILIEVQADIIEVPKGTKEIAIAYAQVRSTELRELNEDYNVMYVERYYVEEDVFIDGELVTQEVEVPNKFILKMVDYVDEEGELVNVDIDEAVGKYSDVATVVSVQKM